VVPIGSVVAEAIIKVGKLSHNQWANNIYKMMAIGCMTL
jgi:hypothetical protein